jgi:hypothetical protein
MTDSSPISTKETPGPFDGFARAKPGEPIFTLQGGDPFGAPLVLLWTDLERRRASGLLMDQDFIIRTVEKIARLVEDEVCEPIAPDKERAMLLRATEAERIAWAMQEYFRGDIGAADERPARTMGGETSAEAEASLDRAQMQTRAGRTLDNALAEANDVANLIAPQGFETAAGLVFSAVAPWSAR